MAAYIASKSVRAVNYGGVIIKGGSGLTSTNLVTRDYAAITSITDEELVILKNDPAFLRAEKDGWVSVVGGNSEEDAYKALSELTAVKDSSLPVQQGDLDAIADKQGDLAGVALLLNEQGALSEAELSSGLVEKSKKAAKA